MVCSTSGFLVHYQLPELTQIHVHCVSDAIQPSISSSIIPFSSHPQSFSASGSFPMSRFFASGSQSIGVAVSASVLPMNIQGCFHLGWTGLVSLQSRGLSSVFSSRDSYLTSSSCLKQAMESREQGRPCGVSQH